MLTFHHAGFIVKDIEVWEKNLLIEEKVGDVIDPLQKARLTLYKQWGSDSFIELIQPLNENAFTWSALQKNGNNFHHFCYCAKSIEDVTNIAKQYNFITVLGPIEAVLFNGKQVIFYYTRNRQIIEFLIG